MPQKWLSKQTLFAKVMERGQLYDHRQDGVIISRILAGTVWDIDEAKCSLSCWNENSEGLICSGCSRIQKKKKKWLKQQEHEETNLFFAFDYLDTISQILQLFTFVPCLVFFYFVAYLECKGMFLRGYIRTLWKK